MNTRTHGNRMFVRFYFPVEFVGFIVWMLRWWNEKRNPGVLGLNP